MHDRLRILFTNNTLSEPAGTELSLFDASRSFLARGCEVAAFSTELGAISERLRDAGVLVLSGLDDLPWTPDLIHGHHVWETTIAALRWPQVPVISFCREPYFWQEAPCRAPNVVLYVVVDEACRLRLVEEEGIPPDKVELVLNGVDLAKFQPRPTLPPKPRRALLLSNYASEDNYLPVVRSACESQGISFSAIGRKAGHPCANPAEVLGEYDIVFAKGKAALESMVTGCALIVADTAGLGPMVTRENFTALRRMSFGNPTMTDVFSVESVSQRLLQYDAGEATAAAAEARATCGLPATIDNLEKAYARARAAPFSATSGDRERFTAEFLTSRTGAFKLGRRIQKAWHELWKIADPACLDAATANRIFMHFVQNEAKRVNLQARCDRLRAELDELKSKKPAAKSRQGILGRLTKGAPEQKS